VSVDAPFTSVDVNGKHKRKLQEGDVDLSVGDLVGVSVEVRACGSLCLLHPWHPHYICHACTGLLFHVHCCPAEKCDHMEHQHVACCWVKACDRWP
jgi:hypothetical protein